MAANKAGPDSQPRFNYLVCLDIVVLACILVVAGRPDGLAITVTAIIVAIGALVYRCSVGVKSYMADKTRAKQASARQRERAAAQARRSAAPERNPHTGANRQSWLRESD